MQRQVQPLRWIAERYSVRTPTLHPLSSASRYLIFRGVRTIKCPSIFSISLRATKHYPPVRCSMPKFAVAVGLYITPINPQQRQGSHWVHDDFFTASRDSWIMISTLPLPVAWTLFLRSKTTLTFVAIVVIFFASSWEIIRRLLIVLKMHWLYDYGWIFVKVGKLGLHFRAGWFALGLHFLSFCVFSCLSLSVRKLNNTLNWLINKCWFPTIYISM